MSSVSIILQDCLLISVLPQAVVLISETNLMIEIYWNNYSLKLFAGFQPECPERIKPINHAFCYVLGNQF